MKKKAPEPYWAPCRTHLLSLKSSYLESPLLWRSKHRGNQSLGCQMGYTSLHRVHIRIYISFICYKLYSWHIFPVFHCFTLLCLNLVASLKNTWISNLEAKISFKMGKDSQTNLPRLCFHLLSKTSKIIVVFFPWAIIVSFLSFLHLWSIYKGLYVQTVFIYH